MPLAAAQTNVVPFPSPAGRRGLADDLAQLRTLAAQLDAVRRDLPAAVAELDAVGLAAAGIDPGLRESGFDRQVAALADGIHALAAAMAAHHDTL